MKIKLSIILLLIVVCFLGWQYFEKNKNSKITFVFSGVLQGNILPYREKYGPLKGKYVGGLAYISGYYNKLKSKNKPFVFLDCGDNYSGTPESYYTQGEAIVTGLNALGLSAMSIGNREFDFGANKLIENIAKSKFTYLATNLRENNSKGMKFEYVKLIKSGKYKIGIIGIVPPDTSQMTEASNTKGYTFLTIKDSVPSYMKFLKKKGVDFIVILSQLDIDVNTKEIDYLISLGADIIQVLEYTSKSKKFQKRKDSFLICHDGYAKGSNVQLLNVEIVNGKLICSDYKRVYIEKDKLSPDNDLSISLNEYVRKIDEIMNKVIGTIDKDYKNEYYKESAIGNFICDSIKDEAKADIALQNSGGIRANLKKGNFTIRMLHDILPFDNEVILVEITGQELEKVFKNAASLKYGVLQVSGVRYEIKKSKNEGNKLVNIMINGNKIDYNKKYKVVANSFLTGGGDGYISLKKAKKIKVFGSLREMIKNKISSSGKFISQLEGRIKITE